MSITDLRGIVIVTGTDTDAGKTVATAALASCLDQNRVDVAVCKPAQTGLAPGEPGDVEIAAALAGLPMDRCHELVRLPEPLAPTTAARRAGIVPPSVDELAEQVAALADAHEVLLVEGAGGILVGLDGHGRGLLELADALVACGHAPTFVVVCRGGLGTLNHTQLTCRAITDRGHVVAGVVVGTICPEPDLAERCNLEELSSLTGVPLLAVLPHGLGSDAESLRRLAGEIA